jgi:uncharacterized membrane protein YvlD (DUF360 family)
MHFARSSVPGDGMPRVRDWSVWSLPPRVRAFVLLVICADLACTGVAAAGFRFSSGDLALFAGLLACGAVTVELTRRASEPAGVVKDVYAVWELPVVILLPVLYALIIPAIRLALTQWRVKRAPPYRRVFTAAAIGLAYGSASLVYHGILPVDGDPRGYLWRHPAMWLVAAGACGLTQWAVNQGLVLSAIRLADPTTRIKATLLGREELHNDATELCAAVLVALGITVSYLTLIIALQQRRGLGARGERGGRPCGPHPVAARRGAARPGHVQADQRHLRPPARRRGAAPDRRHHDRSAARLRPGRPVRR